MRRDGGGVDERFGAYVRERGDHLLRVAVLLTGDWHAAEDLVQASLVKLYRAWPPLDTDADPDAYLRPRRGRRGVMAGEEDIMNDTEERVRHLFAVATEDIPPGIDLLRAVREEQSRSRARTRRVRVALSAGTAAGLAIAVAAAITLSAVPAPSALAQVTKAAKATAGQSYQIRSVSKIVNQDGSAADTPVTVTGEFDPARGAGEQVNSGGSRVLFAGGYMYLSMSGAFKAALERAGRVPVPDGKSWVRFRAPLRPGGQLSVIDLAQIGFATPDMAQLNPQDLLGLLEAASQVSKTGPASGDGWTGSAYAFTATKKFGGSGPLHLVLRISGTVDVDQQGRVRQLDSDYSIGKTEQKVHMTFGNFGLPVSVSAPPASEVFVPRVHG